MRLTTALALAVAVHAAAFALLAVGWPRPAEEPVEVAPLIELASPERAPLPPPPPPLPPLPPAGNGVSRAAGPATRPLGPRTAGVAPLATAPMVVVEGPVAAPVSVAPVVAPLAAAGGAGGGATGAGGGGATGGGAAVTTGSSGGGGNAASDGADRARALAAIRAHRRYPELARRRGVEGTVRVALRVGPDGQLVELRILRGADPILDEAALDAVRAAAPLPPSLHAVGTLEVNLDFHLADPPSE